MTIELYNIRECIDGVLDAYNAHINNEAPSGWCGGPDGCTSFIEYLQDNFERLCLELQDPQSEGKTMFPENWDNCP
jgi:hypothetical protein